jgi:hypothetical protein
MDGGNGASAANLNGGRSPRVLLVEDHDDTRRVTSRLLGLLGCAVTEVKDLAHARWALAGAGTEPFDLLVCDLRLPDGDGRDLMRQAAGCGPVAGIAVSGEAGRGAVERSLAAGFAAHLVKPIVWGELEAAVRRLVPLGRSSTSS